MFLQHRLFFWTRRPSRNIVFYDTKATFPFFVFLFFSQRMSKSGFKIQATFLPLKNTKKLTRGTRFGCQNGPELTSKNQKIMKCIRKVVFWRCRFLSKFRDAKKCNFASPGPVCLPPGPPPGTTPTDQPPPVPGEGNRGGASLSIDHSVEPAPPQG